MIKTTITRRVDTGVTPRLDKKYTIYRDRQLASAGVYNLMSRNAHSSLKAVYSNETIAKLLKDDARLGNDPNSLLSLSFVPPPQDGSRDNVPLYFADPVTSAPTTKPFAEFADVFLDNWWGMEQQGKQADVASTSTNSRGLLLRQLLGTENSTTFHFTPIGSSTFVDRRVDGGSPGTYVIYHFVTWPSGMASCTPLSNQVYSPENILFHYPYRLKATGAQSCPLWNNTTLGTTTFTTVIDELSEKLPNSTVKPTYDTYWPSNGTLAALKKRRVVQMNSAGFILQDRTWTCNGSNCTLTSRDGVEEVLKYDCMGRVIQHRTKAWGSPKNGDPDSEGLIHFYEYEDTATLGAFGTLGSNDSCNCTDLSAPPGSQSGPTYQRPGELIAEGVMQGKNGQVKAYTHVVKRHQDRKDLVVQDVRFRNPVSSFSYSNFPGNGPDVELVQTDYEFGTGPDPNDNSTKPLVYKNTYYSPTKTSLDDDTPRYRVLRTMYDSYGNVQWSGVGMLSDPSGTPGQNTNEQFFATATLFDPRGHLIESILDCDPTNSTGPNPLDTSCNGHEGYSTPTDFPASGNFNRYAPGITRLNHRTINFWYWADPSPAHVLLPNNRQQWRVHLPVNNGIEDSYDEWFYPDLVVDNPVPAEEIPCVAWEYYNVNGNHQQSDFRVLAPVKVSHYEHGKLVSVQTVRKERAPNPPSGEYTNGSAHTINPDEVISIAEAKYDANGRFVGMVARGSETQSPPTVSGFIAYDGFGNIMRQQDADRTITRNTYDDKGRLEKVYRGTNDEHDHWQTAVHCDSQGQPPGCIPVEQSFADNLTLVEKRYYCSVKCNSQAVPPNCDDPTDFTVVNGDGVNDIDQLTQMRDYRDHPANQYGGANPSNEDSLGYLTIYKYDWRQRVVWTQRQNAAGSPLTHTVTYYDNLDRVRLTAEFGSSAPTSAADGTLLDASAASTVSSLLSAGATSLTETIYNQRGQVEETRNYDVGNTSGAAYTATVNYYGTFDKPTEVHAPNSPVMRYTYDGKGRQVSAGTMAKLNGGTLREMARTDTQYDNNDRATVVNRSERLDTAGDDNALGSTNSVRTTTYTWYDPSGRVIATANFGTNHAEDKFITGSGLLPPYNDIAPPVVWQTSLTVGACNYNAFAGESTVPIAPQITCYGYDGDGRQNKVFHPDGTITETKYDSLGRTIETIQNAGDSDATMRQRTGYVYDPSTGQLTKIQAILPDNSTQTTEMIYGADVVDSAWNTISANNAFIKEVRFPDRATGAPAASDKFTFKYFPDGKVAERTDQRGINFRYHYDELGRLTEVIVNDTAWYPVPTPIPATGDYRPPNRITRILYEYTADGLPTRVTAAFMNGVYEDTLAESEFEYDTHKNLTHEQQFHFGLYPPAIPTIHYAWDYQPHMQGGQPTGANHNRLASLTYPVKLAVGGTSRVISLGYGSTGSADDALNRITSISSSGVTGPLATYAYAGTGRRVAKTMANGKIQQSFASSPTSGVYDKLDRFGRVKDLHYTQSPSGNIIRRDQYGYDLVGNRLYDRVTQKSVGGVSHDNDRSWLYAYDKLHRLIDAKVGQLEFGESPSIATASGAPPWRSTQWHLDNLGNWAGGVDNPGMITTSSAAPPVWQDHAVNKANEIKWTTTPSEGTIPTQITYFIHDPAGNLAYDGQFIYQYDAWNRLIQVNMAGTLPENWNGQVLDTSVLGAFVCRYTYDGIGRMIVKETPTGANSGYLQRKDLYYDGVRRIAETIWRGDLAPLLSEGGGNDESPYDPEDPFRNSTTNETYLWTDREYAYGPEYVDEFVCQFGEVQPTTMYLVQDANYNVVAVCNGLGSVLEQTSFDPYGTVNALDQLASHAVNRVGHQGLFYERYDGAYDQPAIAPGVAGLYYNRNRFYSPTLGRFITRDPNETGMPILTAMAMNGESAFILCGAFAGQSLYGDGMSLYQYMGSNPANSNDPAGTDFTLSSTLVRTALMGGIAGALLGGALRAALHGGIDESWGTAVLKGASYGGAAGFTGGATFAFASSMCFLAQFGFSGAVAGFTGTAVAGGGWGDCLRGAIEGAVFSVAFGGLGRIIGSAWSSNNTGVLTEIFASEESALGVLKGQLPADIPEVEAAARASGWKVTGLARGGDEGAGLRMYDPKGDKLISWSPGTLNRHGGSYWKVSSGKTGTWRIASK